MTISTTQRLIRMSPAFIVRDVSASVAFYRDKLGFRVKIMHGDPPEFAILRRDGCELVVKRGDTPTGVRNRQQVRGDWFYDAMVTAAAPEDVDDFYRAMVAAGAPAPEAPHTEDGMRVFALTDPDGYRLFVHAAVE